MKCIERTSKLRSMIVDIYSGEVFDHDEKAENVLVRIRDGSFTILYS